MLAQFAGVRSDAPKSALRRTLGEVKSIRKHELEGTLANARRLRGILEPATEW
jgi:hypothetical protein